MPQVVAELAVQVGPIVDGVHLVDHDAVQLVGVRLDGIEQRHRLAVGQRHDEVGSTTDVFEDGIGHRDSTHPTRT